MGFLEAGHIGKKIRVDCRDHVGHGSCDALVNDVSQIFLMFTDNLWILFVPDGGKIRIGNLADALPNFKELVDLSLAVFEFDSEFELCLSVLLLLL